MQQQIRFCKTSDAVRLAYATVGTGKPLVKAANWLSQVEYDWRTPIWRPLFERLAHNRRLVRYDERGCGLSDWEVDEWTVGGRPHRDGLVDAVRRMTRSIGIVIAIRKAGRRSRRSRRFRREHPRPGAVASPRGL